MLKSVSINNNEEDRPLSFLTHLCPTAGPEENILIEVLEAIQIFEKVSMYCVNVAGFFNFILIVQQIDLFFMSRSFG